MVGSPKWGSSRGSAAVWFFRFTLQILDRDLFRGSIRSESLGEDSIMCFSVQWHEELCWHIGQRSFRKARNWMRLDEGYFGGKPTKEPLFIFGDRNRQRGCATEEMLLWCKPYNFPEYSGYLVKVPAGICKLYSKTVQLPINRGLL